MTTKKLTKSYNKRLSGVCGGIAEYFDIDPTAVRLGYICLELFSGAFPGIILYIVMALILPDPDTKLIDEK